MTWNIRGTYVESCNCEAACPCVFLSDPTNGDCTVLVGWHIDQGSISGLDLGGLNVAMAAVTDGNMAKVPWRAALYLDQRAADDQAQALTEIFTGQVGGHPARLAQHIGEVLGMHRTAIEFTGTNGSRRLRIGDVANLEVAAIAGQDGGQVTISGHPLAIAPGNPAVAARSDHLRYTDHGFNWELSERNGFFSPFAYEG